MVGIGAWIVGVFLAAVAVAGLVLAAEGHDRTFYWMGLALFAFAYGLIMLMIKSMFDRRQ